VERLGSPPVASPNVGASRDEELGELRLMPRGCEVQRGVARIHVVANRRQEVRVRILAGRSDAKWPRDETWNFVELSRNPVEVTRGDGGEELEKHTVATSIEALPFVRHSHRMSDPRQRLLPATWQRSTAS
jgi:hypothetical protein